MRIRVSAAALITIALASGCTYAVKPMSAPAVNVYTSYDDKIPGRWAVVVDDSVNVRRELKASTHVCSAHTYPFEAGETLRTSIHRTMEQVFETAEPRPTPPSSSDLEAEGLMGYTIVRLNDLIPRISCQMGFWSGTCTGSADLSLAVEVIGRTGKLLGSSVGSTKSADGDAGGACGGAAEQFSEAYRLALKETLERMAERIGNAERVREAASAGVSQPAG